MRITLLLVGLLTSYSAQAQNFKAIVADVGSGLCVIIEMPDSNELSDPYYMVYDVGQGCRDDIADIIPENQQIDLLVLSHNDSDHISDADEILEDYEVSKILWSGFERPEVGTWRSVNNAINLESLAEVINLADINLPIGTTWVFGDTYVTFVSGYYKPPSFWGFTPSMHSEYRNAGSIVMRVVYQGASLLLTGDMIGRLEDDGFPEDSVVAAEALVIKNSVAVPIDSDILVASHHGGNDASSYPFIQAVSPQYVIFPSGSRDYYGHPRKATAQRFMNSGVSVQNIYRTDRSDDESHEEHWEPGGATGMNDPSGDDNIQIIITNSGAINVEYESQ